MNDLKVAILYQAKIPPVIDGIIKPMKKGGYSDSGADIAFALQQNNVEVITPVSEPKINIDLDWVFPDTEVGIKDAIHKGANLFWLNTVLYSAHPILKFKNSNLFVVGQDPQNAEMFDNKFYANNIIRENLLPVPKSYLTSTFGPHRNSSEFPVVLKPIRGRGSQGVMIAHNRQEFDKQVKKFISSKIYGTKVMVEEFLEGTEITITVMPPGKYWIKCKNIEQQNYWALPAVNRFGHEKGVAPYSGIIAVVKNSKLLSKTELQSREIKDIAKKCELTGKIIGARAPIRIDCRKNKAGEYQLFDINMKPNMTGESRNHRKDQDSLTMIAARGIGWSYPDLIKNILSLHWKI